MAAVDMLATQLQLNLAGAPEWPRSLTFNSDWYDAEDTHRSA